MKGAVFNLQETQKRNSRRRFIVKLSVLMFFFALLVFGAVRVIFHSSLFKFSDLVINNLGTEDKRESLLAFLESKIDNGPFIRRTLGFNNLLAWPNQIPGSEIAFLSGVKRIEIEKGYRDHVLTVNIIEQEPLGIWCLSKTPEPKCFWFNKEGVIFKEAPVTSGNLIRTISDFSQDHLGVNSRILPEEFLDNLISILNTVSLAKLSPREIVLRDLSLQEVEVILAGGPKILFSLRHNAEPYLAPLKSLMADPKFRNLDYVDLRVENRVYHQ